MVGKASEQGYTYLKQNVVGRCKAKIGLVIVYNWLKRNTMHRSLSSTMMRLHKNAQLTTGTMKAPDCLYGLTEGQEKADSKSRPCHRLSLTLNLIVH